MWHILPAYEHFLEIDEDSEYSFGGWIVDSDFDDNEEEVCFLGHTFRLILRFGVYMYDLPLNPMPFFLLFSSLFINSCVCRRIFLAHDAQADDYR